MDPLRLGAICVACSFTVLCIDIGLADDSRQAGPAVASPVWLDDLIAAIRHQDPSKIAKILAGDVDVNAMRGDGSTAIHWASHHDDLETAKLLIAGGADVRAKNDLGVQALSLACVNGSLPMATMLLEAGANPNDPQQTGETPLMTASRAGKLDVVRVLIEHDAEVDAKEPVRKQTALMWALDKKHADIARMLLARGADIHAKTTMGFTPLMFACRQGDVVAVETLLDKGAYINSESEKKLTPLHIATVRGHTDVARMLLDRGADPNADGPGYTALHWAAGRWETELTAQHGITAPADHEWNRMSGIQDGKLELIKALLESGADPDARLRENPERYGFTSHSKRPPGCTPFALAALAGDTKVMKLLVEHGADPLIPADNGATPLMMAAGLRRNLAENVISEQASLSAVRLAVELGNDVNARDEAGNTALHGAARLRSAAIVRFLVDQGADVNVLNELGHSPAFAADRYWHASRHIPEYAPSEAGKLLRDLTLPKPIQDAVENWAILSPEVRQQIESLIVEQQERMSELKQRRNRNPMFRLDGTPMAQ